VRPPPWLDSARRQARRRSGPEADAAAREARRWDRMREYGAGVVAVTESDNGDPIEAARQALEDAAGETLPGAGLMAKWDGASARLEALAARLRGCAS